MEEQRKEDGSGRQEVMGVDQQVGNQVVAGSQGVYI